MRVRGREPIEGIDWDLLGQQKIALLQMQDYYEPDESYYSIVGKIPMNGGEEE